MIWPPLTGRHCGSTFSKSENETNVDYVRSIVPGVTRADVENDAVEHSYMVKARR
jgi:hypothetical protein